MNRSKASLSVIFVTVFIDLMGFGILIPIIPSFASKDLGISDFGIGLIVAIYSLVQFLLNPIFGKVSDKIGRKPIILLSLLTTAISYLIFSVADSFLILFLSRMLAGLGGSNIGVAQAYIADITTKEDRYKGMGMIGAAFGLGFVFGPLIGGFLSQYGFEVTGYASAGFSFLAMLFAIFFLPESREKKLRSATKVKYQIFDFEEIRNAIKIPHIGILMLIFFIIIFSMANIYGTFAILGYKRFHFSDLQNGYLFGLMGIVGAIIQGGVIRRASKIFSDGTLMKFGLVCLMLGLGFIPYGYNFLGVALSVTVLSIGSGILQPVILSMVSRFAPDDRQGSILGINQSFSSLARVLGPIWGGFAFDYFGFEFPFLTGALFTFITFIITINYLNNNRSKES